MSSAGATAAIIQGLKSAGWLQDVATGAIRPGCAPVALPDAGRAIIRSPKGILHEVSPGDIHPLAGRYHVMGEGGTFTRVDYVGGREVAAR